MVPPVGIIITVTVLVAAGVAAYENPHVRAWIDRTRHKIAIGLHSLGDEIQSNQGQRRRPSLNDASMHEEKSEWADERRRQAIAEIMERGRVMEERRKRRKVSGGDEPRTPSFDTIVDDNGSLLHNAENGGPEPTASSSAIDPSTASACLKKRQKLPQLSEIPATLHQPVTGSQSPTLLTPPPIDENDNDPFESRYEQEMREAWNIPVGERQLEVPSSNESESLMNFTPTTEEAPDPDFSVPSSDYFHRPLDQSDYFSASVANSAQSSSHREPQGSVPEGHHHNIYGTVSGRSATTEQVPPPSTSTVAGSMSSIHPSEAEESSDDLLSEVGDGLRTPGSAWTEVDSTVSGDFNL